MTLESAYSLLAMLVALAGCSLLAPYVFVPYPILLVASGLGLSMLPGVTPPLLDPNLILLVLLPPLLYKESFDASWRDFTRWVRPIATLAVGLVAATIIAVACVVRWIAPEVPWPVAFMLGAIVSPTDTVAAMAVIHRLRVPRRLSAILGGESLVNDATGLVALQLAIGVAISGIFSVVQLGGQFVWTVIAGLSIGLLVGVIADQLNRRIRDTSVLFTLSLIAPYGAFALADEVGASGVLAVVAAGFYVSWRMHRVAADTRYQLWAVWRLSAYVVDGLTFVLIGTTLTRLLNTPDEDVPFEALVAGLAVTLTLIAVRFAWVFPNAYLPLMLSRKLREREGGYPAPRNVLLTCWCGMRGAVSLAAALSIPMTLGEAPFVDRNFVILVTVVVVMGTLLVQGTSLPYLIQALRIKGDRNAGEEERLARVALTQAALSTLDALRVESGIDPADIDHVERTYMERLSLQIDAIARRHGAEDVGPAKQNIFDLGLRALAAERAALLALRDGARINDSTHVRLEEELDIAEMRLRSAAIEGTRDGVEL